MSLYAETSGHFVDRTVGKITDLERGDHHVDDPQRDEAQPRRFARPRVAAELEILILVSRC